MTWLEILDLGGTKITDAGLVHLKGLTELKELEITGTGVTDAGVAQIKAVLPECKIRR